MYECYIIMPKSIFLQNTAIFQYRANEGLSNTGNPCYSFVLRRTPYLCLSTKRIEISSLIPSKEVPALYIPCKSIMMYSTNTSTVGFDISTKPSHKNGPHYVEEFRMTRGKTTKWVLNTAPLSCVIQDKKRLS